MCGYNSLWVCDSFSAGTIGTRDRRFKTHFYALYSRRCLLRAPTATQRLIAIFVRIWSKVISKSINSSKVWVQRMIAHFIWSPDLIKDEDYIKSTNLFESSSGVTLYGVLPMWLVFIFICRILWLFDECYLCSESQALPSELSMGCRRS